LILAASSRQFMNSIKAKFSVAFKMCQNKPSTYVLRIEINRDCKLCTISLSQ
ncbi:hypothetical protein PAXRUDRAFT_128205, partial [Paxillus rubicundulus Ve08.2h10]